MNHLDITCISDLHMSFPDDLPGGDILFIAGDISFDGGMQQITDFNHWVSQQDYRYKVMIAGNHDFLFERNPPLARSLISGITHYLEDEMVVIEGLKIWGSPITPWFMDMAFNRHRDEIQRHWDNIPLDTDIIITHGPPYGILDQILTDDHQRENVGCVNLLKKIKEIKPKIHLFGHIHEGFGIHEEEGTTFINAARMDKHYYPKHPHHHIKIKKKS